MPFAPLAPPLDPAELWTRLAEIPRVRLAALPTPLEECRQLSAKLGGPRILVKRDDLTGLAFGGNKSRNLEFRLAEAIDEGADTIVVALETISNSARQTVGAANRLGMRTVLVLRGRRPEILQGNLLINYLLGADVRFTDSPENTLPRTTAEAVADELRRDGRRPFILNASPMFAAASALAYTLCVLELQEQLAAMGSGVDWIYLSSRSKGQAGVVLGARALGASFKVVGIAAGFNPNGAANTAQIANDAARLLNLDFTITPDEIVNHDGYAGDGYGIPSPAGIEAIQIAARSEGLMLDPVYTGKAMAGLIDHIRSGRISSASTVVFIHTGGTPAIFDHGELLLTQPSQSIITEENK